VTVACLAASPLAAQTAQTARTAQTVDETRDVNLRAYAELLRSDIRAQKVAIITEVMGFTEDEDTKFWPIYRQYETDLAKINDDRLALIKEYADTYEAMTDATANKLARAVLDLEARRNTLKATTYDRLQAALPAKTAARFLQVENQILLLIDLQIAASLPVVR
jgi:hypothetical protein